MVDDITIFKVGKNFEKCFIFATPFLTLMIVSVTCLSKDNFALRMRPRYLSSLTLVTRVPLI